MRILKKTALFCLGGGAYGLIELLWRGRTHSSMLLLGGGCFMMLGRLRRLRLPLPLLVILGAGAITAGELLVGLLVNRDYAVWDYRGMPLNFMGQICLPYTLLWMPLSLAGMHLYDLADRVVR